MVARAGDIDVLDGDSVSLRGRSSGSVGLPTQASPGRRLSASTESASTSESPAVQSATEQASITLDQTDETARLDAKPGVMQWVLSVILVTLLCGHLVRIWRVLRGENALVLQRSAPEGMRTVQCGHCHRMQYLQTHIRIFNCYHCGSTNRLTADPIRSSPAPALELIESTGPCKKYEFRRQGELLWQVIKEEIDEGSSANLADSTSAEDGPGDSASEKSSQLEPEQNNEGDAPQAPTNALREEDGQELTVLDIDEAAGAAGATGPPPVPETKGGPRSRGSRRSRRRGGGEWEPCGVCWDDPGRMVLLPCSHGSVCQECAVRIAQNRASGGAKCPHCRTEIAMLVKLTEVHGENQELARGVEHRVPIARGPSVSAGLNR